MIVTPLFVATLVGEGFAEGLHGESTIDHCLCLSRYIEEVHGSASFSSVPLFFLFRGLHEIPNIFTRPTFLARLGC